MRVAIFEQLHLGAARRSETRTACARRRTLHAPFAGNLTLKTESHESGSMVTWQVVPLDDRDRRGVRGDRRSGEALVQRGTYLQPRGRRARRACRWRGSKLHRRVRVVGHVERVRVRRLLDVEGSLVLPRVVVPGCIGGGYGGTCQGEGGGERERSEGTWRGASSGSWRVGGVCRGFRKRAAKLPKRRMRPFSKKARPDIYLGLLIGRELIICKKVIN